MDQMSTAKKLGLLSQIVHEDQSWAISEVVRLRGLLRKALDEHCGCLPDRWCEEDRQPQNDCQWPDAECFQETP